MSADPRQHFTLEEYFALERASERRWEFRDGEVVCMSGGSRAHGRIAGNVHARLAARLAGSPCVPYTSDTALLVPAAPPYRYPDASVVCGDERFESINGLDALANPVVVVEVLSPTSADFDRGTKFEWYRSIPTFREYLLVSQDRPRITHRILQSDGAWLESTHDGMDAVVTLRSIAVELSLAEVFEGVF